MRSSKSRSRNKSRNQRSLGNVVNRVFDSSGPEGKVRGTPQQIIEKYLALARDAQLSNDRVAEQSFFQHAEHYTRMLGEAQREQAERQAQFGGQNPNQADDRDDRGQGWQNQNGHNQGQQGQQGGDRRDDRQDRDNRRDDRDNRQDRGDRQDRDNRQDRRRDDRPDNRRDDRDRQPLTGDADAAPDVLPDFLRAPNRGIPEALPVDGEDGPVETPESRGARDEPEPTESADLLAETPETAEPAAADAPRTRRPRTAAGSAPTATRRASRKRVSAEVAGDNTPTE